MDRGEGDHRCHGRPGNRADREESAMAEPDEGRGAIPETRDTVGPSDIGGHPHDPGPTTPAEADPDRTRSPESIRSPDESADTSDPRARLFAPVRPDRYTIL